MPPQPSVPSRSALGNMTPTGPPIRTKHDGDPERLPCGLTRCPGRIGRFQSGNAGIVYMAIGLAVSAGGTSAYFREVTSGYIRGPSTPIRIFTVKSPRYEQPSDVSRLLFAERIRGCTPRVVSTGVSDRTGV